MAREDWTYVCEVDELIPDTGACALVNNEQVAIFWEKKSNQLFALSNFDPVGLANVISRGILGSLGEELVVASPLYKQHFSLVTGQCIEDPQYCLKTYPVRRIDGKVQLKISKIIAR
ncbi:MAG: nitrite reductase small subunit NirD [Pseudomonadales bacterium]|nr:nitrite reductase small subunit NirD [Pseudomonadales bacterium]